eukprot:2024683-Amphidinium_carterae.1
MSLQPQDANIVTSSTPGASSTVLGIDRCGGHSQIHTVIKMAAHVRCAIHVFRNRFSSLSTRTLLELESISVGTVLARSSNWNFYRHCVFQYLFLVFDKRTLVFECKRAQSSVVALDFRPCCCEDVLKSAKVRDDHKKQRKIISNAPSVSHSVGSCKSSNLPKFCLAGMCSSYSSEKLTLG